MKKYRMAVVATSVHDTESRLPTSMSLRCSPSDVDLLSARIVAAEATAYEMPMIASCGIRACRLRTNEKMPAPMNVNRRLIQYTPGECGSPFDQGIRIDSVPPSAAIWASERSTKMTPRSTTWTPRYACIPVRMRLATNGAARNSSIEVSTLFAPSCLLDRFDEQVDVVIEQLEVVGDFLDPAAAGRHDQDVAADVAGDLLRRLQVEVRLDQDQLHVLPLHVVDQIERVLRRRRNAGPRLDVADDVEAEPLGKIRERPVVGDDLQALEGPNRRRPFLWTPAEAPLKSGGLWLEGAAT